MKLNVISNGHEQHAALLTSRICERVDTELCTDGTVIELAVDPLLGPKESYEIRESEDRFLVVAADGMGLYFGIGKLLHTA